MISYGDEPIPIEAQRGIMKPVTNHPVGDAMFDSDASIPAVAQSVVKKPATNLIGGDATCDGDVSSPGDGWDTEGH